MIGLIVSLSLSLAAIGFSLHLSVTYRKFNDSVSKWSQELDAEMRDSIARASRQLLREMDSKISNLNEHENDSAH